MTLRSVVVVGGGIAGVSTVAELRKRGFDERILLIDADGLPYDRPPLSKGYLDGSKSRADLLLHEEEWYLRNDVELHLGRAVTDVRPADAAVALEGGRTLRADAVVLATGGAAARASIPGADDARVHVLRTAEDADRLRASLVPGARLLVVGAGLIGAEAASTAQRLGVDVVLLDPVAAPLSAAVGPDLAVWLHELHEHRGIRTVESGLDRLAAEPAGLVAHLDDGRTYGPFDAVLLGVGMRPSTQLAQAAGLTVDQGIVVDELQRTSNPAVLAVGDPTRRCVEGVLLRRAEHWEAAQLDGARAAAALTGTEPPAESCSWFWSDRHGIHLEVVGSLGAAEATVTRGALGDAAFAVLGMCEGRLVGAAAVDDSTTIRAARRLIDRRVAVDAAALADPATDLRKLVRGRP